MNGSVVLYQCGDSTPEGDPVLINPAAVAALVPYDRNPKKTVVILTGNARFTVKGEFAEVRAKLGFGEAAAPEKAKPLDPDEPL